MCAHEARVRVGVDDLLAEFCDLLPWVGAAVAHRDRGVGLPRLRGVEEGG